MSKEKLEKRGQVTDNTQKLMTACLLFLSAFWADRWVKSSHCAPVIQKASLVG